MSQAAPHLLFNEVLTSGRLTRKCLGVAKNYFTHALRNDPSKVVLPPYPYIFSKSMSALLPKGQSFTIPRHCPPNTVNFEVELGVMLRRGSAGRAYSNKEEWRNNIGAFFLLIDFTDAARTNAAV